MMQKEKLKNDFIQKSIKQHGNKYDYSKVEYKDRLTKVCIVCPEHGEFWQAPCNHTIGLGCIKCGYIKRKNKGCNSTSYFIKSARRVHGDKYDYSKTIYNGSKNKISFICPIHGEVSMIAGNHVRGHGCPKCGKEQMASKSRTTLSSFIEKSIRVHGSKYDYSKVKYKNNHSKVCIVCPIHGEFWQTPNNHLNGSECPECAYSKTKNLVAGIGINDCDFSAKSKCYRTWKSILERTSHDKCSSAYENVSVCEEWKHYSNFKKWYERFHVSGFAIDKDLLSCKNHKTYSPKTCCFLPRIINNVIKTYYNHKHVGIKVLKNGKFKVKLNRNSKAYDIGCFDNYKDASFAYKQAKEQYIKELAEKYFKEGSITEEAYNALIKYEVCIND
jgi:hypothetical protein